MRRLTDGGSYEGREGRLLAVVVDEYDDKLVMDECKEPMLERLFEDRLMLISLDGWKAEECLFRGEQVFSLIDRTRVDVVPNDWRCTTH